MFGKDLGTTVNWTAYEKQPSADEEQVYQLAAGAAGENISWVLMSDGALTVTGSGSMDYDPAWKVYNPMLTSVEIGEGVTSIASSAFYECVNLTSVSLPSTLKTIGNNAFYKCIKLPVIQIPASVTSLDKSAFYECSAMTKIVVAADNTKYSSDEQGILFNKDKTELLLCPRGFSGSYEIPAGVVTVTDYAFRNCTGLTGVTIPNTATTIGYCTFSGCVNLGNVTIPSGVATIGSYAFSNCDSFTEITIPGTVVSIGSEVFNSCDNLATVVIENGLVSMGEWAFDNCHNLTSVTLPDTLVSLNAHAFYGCSSLESITIPKKVSYVDLYVFNSCNALKEVKFTGDAPVFEGTIFSNYYDRPSVTVYYPAGNATWNEEVFGKDLGTTVNWTAYDATVEPGEEGTVYIVAQGSCGANVSWKIMSDGRLVIYGSGSMQFMMRSGAAPWSAYSDQITSIVVTTGVSSIADNAFADCSNVTTVSVADTVRTIGDEAFVGCESLETITFTGNAPKLGENCFEDVNANIQYPKNNSTWTEEVREDFGEEVTFVTLDVAKGHSYADKVDGICDECGVDRAAIEHRQVTHMFRMYNPNTGEHFYTGSQVERDNLIVAGWQYEGVGFTFPANTGAPVYRLFQPSTGEHLYTMDVAEKNKLEADGWNYEGIAFNSAYDTEAVQHRLHNPNTTVGAYHFTFSEEEKDNLIAAGWEYQGIGWYSCWK